MSAPAQAEFSRFVRLDQIGRLPPDQQITADAAERTALAERFGFLALDHLEATYTLRRDARDIAATGRLRARLVQACIATGEPVPEEVDLPFSLRFVQEEEEATGMPAGAELEIDAEEEDVIPFTGQRFNIGEAVAETLALSVARYPRADGAEDYLRAMGVLREEDAGPFAALAALKNG